MSISSSRKRGAPGTLAVVEGRDRHQLAFGRDRDRQSRTRFRLSRLSRGPDRRRDRARSRRRGAPRHCEGARARAFRRGTRAQASGEKFPWARPAAAGVGLWLEPAPIAPRVRPRRSRRGRRRAATHARPLRLRRGHHPPRQGDQRGDRRVPAPLPPRASTASPTRRPSKRCDGCLPSLDPIAESA